VKVIAIRTGFYAGQRIRPGVEFEYALRGAEDAEAYLPSWVVPVESADVVFDEPVVGGPVIEPSILLEGTY